MRRKFLPKHGKVEPDITAFPFRELGTTTDYVVYKKKDKYKEMLSKLLEEYIDANDGDAKAEEKNMYWLRIINEYDRLNR